MTSNLTGLKTQVVIIPGHLKQAEKLTFTAKCLECDGPINPGQTHCPEPTCQCPLSWPNFQKPKRMYSGDKKTTLPAFLSDTTMKVARLAEIKEFPAPRKKDGNHHFLEQGLHKYELLYGSEYVMDIARKCQIEHSRNNKPLGTILLNHILRCLENGQDPTLKNKPKFQSAEDKSQGESW